eukprot:SAG31_NODE_2900_length_4934_cov_2.001448_4_plen_176_part_00
MVPLSQQKHLLREKSLRELKPKFQLQNDEIVAEPASEDDVDYSKIRQRIDQHELFWKLPCCLAPEAEGEDDDEGGKAAAEMHPNIAGTKSCLSVLLLLNSMSLAMYLLHIITTTWALYGSQSWWLVIFVLFVAVVPSLTTLLLILPQSCLDYVIGISIEDLICQKTVHAVSPYFA